MSFLRSTLALILLIAAVACGLAGLGSQWLDQVARTPDPLRAIVGPVAKDDAVIRALATELEQAAHREIPAVADQLPGLRAELESLLDRGIDQALSDEGLNRAWYGSIDLARERAVADLDRMRDSKGGGSPMLWFPLRPFVELGTEKVYEIADPRLHSYLDLIQIDKDLALPLGRIAEEEAPIAADALGVADHWGLYYVVAGGLALTGLLVGSRRGRWVALLVAALMGVAALFISARAVEFMRIPSSSTVTGAIQARLIAGTAESITQWIDKALVVGLVVAGLAAVGLVIAAVTRTRAVAL